MTGAMYESRKRRWLLRMPRHHADSTSSPAPGNRMRTIAIVSSRFSPSKPGAMTATSSGVASTPPATSTRCHEREQRAHRAGDPHSLLALLAREQRGVDRNERRRQRAFAEQVLQEVRDAERRHERVGGVRLQAEVMRENALADETGEPAAEDAECYQRGGTIHLKSGI